MLKQNNFTFIDLFSGIGGFRLALNNLGGSCVNFSEINKDAIDAYCTNFEEETAYNLGDITKIKALLKHDLINSVSVPVVQMLGQAIMGTGVFDKNNHFKEHKQEEMYEMV